MYRCREAGKALGLRIDNFMHDSPGAILGGLKVHADAGAFVLKGYGNLLGMVQQREHHGARLCELAEQLWGDRGKDMGLEQNWMEGGGRGTVKR